MILFLASYFFEPQTGYGPNFGQFHYIDASTLVNISIIILFEKSGIESLFRIFTFAIRARAVFLRERIPQKQSTLGKFDVDFDNRSIRMETCARAYISGIGNIEHDNTPKCRSININHSEPEKIKTIIIIKNNLCILLIIDKSVALI